MPLEHNRALGGYWYWVQHSGLHELLIELVSSSVSTNNQLQLLKLVLELPIMNKPAAFALRPHLEL